MVKKKLDAFSETQKLCKIEISLSEEIVLLENSQAYSFIYCLWMLLHFKDMF